MAIINGEEKDYRRSYTNTNTYDTNKINDMNLLLRKEEGEADPRGALFRPVEFRVYYIDKQNISDNNNWVTSVFH